MALQTDRRILQLLGIAIKGDLGHLTMYRSRFGRMVWFTKTYPKKPPSPPQLEQRAKFADAAAAWRALTAAARRRWKRVAAAASLCATGYDLYVHWSLTQDHAAIHTLERQTGIELLPP